MGDSDHQKLLNEIHSPPQTNPSEEAPLPNLVLSETEEKLKRLEKLLNQQKDHIDMDPVYRC